MTGGGASAAGGGEGAVPAAGWIALSSKLEAL